MTTASYRRQTSEASPFRGPLLAGGGTAVLFALGIAAIALFGDPDGRPPIGRAGLGPAPEPPLRAEVTEVESARRPQPVQFEGDDPDIEPSLPGIEDVFDPGPLAGSDPGQAEIDHARAANALPAAPLAGLTEPGPSGPLPIIGVDGSRASQAYARPWHGDPNTPAIAIVVGGMGLNRAVTEAAIENLPPEVALSFAPYANDLQGWVDRARAAGHEVLIEIPMEPYDYPNNDPGPHTLLVDAGATENARRLTWLMSQTTGYFAVTNYLGARFTSTENPLADTMRRLERRGVAFLHDGSGRRATVEAAGRAAGAHWGIADRVLDEDPSPRSIDERLLMLEALAIQNGSAIGAGFAYPATVDQVESWAAGLEARGYVLAPPSAIMNRRAAQRAADEPSYRIPPARSEEDSGDGH
ncbi:divergent polysaccharide deacetylase family protein [Hyphobacterium marinum]|uniref:Divergent polysaccharide deacetylase family protein n=1 Tax=Hyphobacterium marinum TaxID=3116574 RepID=A0ABU7LVP4_9PROT|nr:divergent polysaccharide deacetylase family protein [Hyphobacterium sp. Y6023]MEE2565641.1 divergent polysaccharide deacetylase family protein [Hyphobacterium sp. Y6023]